MNAKRPSNYSGPYDPKLDDYLNAVVCGSRWEQAQRHADVLINGKRGAISNEFLEVCRALFISPNGKQDGLEGLERDPSTGTYVAGGEVQWGGTIGGVIDRWQPNRRNEPMKAWEMTFEVTRDIFKDPSITIRGLIWGLVERIIYPMWLVTRMKASVIDGEKISVKLHVKGLK